MAIIAPVDGEGMTSPIGIPSTVPHRPVGLLTMANRCRTAARWWRNRRRPGAILGACAISHPNAATGAGSGCSWCSGCWSLCRSWSQPTTTSKAGGPMRRALCGRQARSGRLPVELVVAAGLGMRVRARWATVGAPSLVMPAHAQSHGRSARRGQRCCRSDPATRSAASVSQLPRALTEFRSWSDTRRERSHRQRP